MKLVYFLICLILASSHGLAQTAVETNRPPKNSINFEIGGTGLLYSLGYERVLCTKTLTSHSIKIAAGYPFIGGLDYLIVPVDYNFYLGKTSSKLILGAGLVNLIGTASTPNGIAAQKDFRKLYNEDPYAATNKYGTDHLNSSYDIAFTAKLGYLHSFERINLYAYYNCFYIRFTYQYYFQPFWLGAGVAYKF